VGDDWTRAPTPQRRRSPGRVSEEVGPTPMMVAWFDRAAVQRMPRLQQIAAIQPSVYQTHELDGIVRLAAYTVSSLPIGGLEVRCAGHSFNGKTDACRGKTSLLAPPALPEPRSRQPWTPACRRNDRFLTKKAHEQDAKSLQIGYGVIGASCVVFGTFVDSKSGRRQG